MLLRRHSRSRALAIAGAGLLSGLLGCGDSDTKPPTAPVPTYSGPQGFWSVTYDSVRVTGLGSIGAYVSDTDLQRFSLTRADLDALAKEVLGIGMQSGWVIRGASHPLDGTGLGLDPHPHAITLPTPYDEMMRTAMGSFTLAGDIAIRSVDPIVAAYVADIVPVPVTVQVTTFQLTAKYNMQWDGTFTAFRSAGSTTSLLLTDVQILGVVSNAFGIGDFHVVLSSVDAAAKGTRATRCPECP